MKYLKWFIIEELPFSVILVFSLSLTAAVSPTSDFYGNDYADILSDETERYIIEHSAAPDGATKAQIVVVTVESLDGKPLEEYVTDLFRDFGIGDDELDNGLLILLALSERECRIEVGYGLEGALPDGKTGSMQDEYRIPLLAKNRFDEGILNGYKAFYTVVAAEVPRDIFNRIKIRKQDKSSRFRFYMLWILIIG